MPPNAPPLERLLVLGDALERLLVLGDALDRLLVLGVVVGRLLLPVLREDAPESRVEADGLESRPR